MDFLLTKIQPGIHFQVSSWFTSFFVSAWKWSSFFSHFGWLNTCHLSPNGWQKVRNPWDEWKKEFPQIFISNSSMLPNPCEGFTQNSSSTKHFWYGMDCLQKNICSPSSAKMCKVWMDCHRSSTSISLEKNTTQPLVRWHRDPMNPYLRVRMDTCCCFTFAAWYANLTLTIVEHWLVSNHPNLMTELDSIPLTKRRSTF